MTTAALRIFTLIALWAALSIATPAGAQDAADKTPKVTVSAIPQSPAVRGTDLAVAFVQDIVPDWHTYWVNPGDSGEEMKVTWTSLPDGVIARDGLQWPVPERINYGPLVNFGYHTRAVMIGHLRIPVNYPDDTISARARVTWLVCQEICIPEETTVAITVPVAATAADMSQAPATPLFEAARAAIPRPESWGAMYTVEPGGIKYQITVPEEGLSLLSADTAIDYFPRDYGLTDHAAPLSGHYDEAAKTIFLELGRGDKAGTPVKDHHFVLTFGDQAIELESISAMSHPDGPAGAGAPESSGLPAGAAQGLTTLPGMTAKTAAAGNEPALSGPADAAPVPALSVPAAENPSPAASQTPASAVSDTAPPAAPHTAPSGALPAAAGHAAPASLELAKYILFALLGGIILNLMPCVFPVLSIKALSIVRLSEGARLKIWGHGLAYTAGILASFAAIAFALLSLRQAGENIGWGFQLQNPNMVIALSWLLFAVGLNLSGVFEISLGRVAGAGEGLARKPGLAGAFFTGVLATLVATPCTAPFMAGALGAAILLPTAQAMAVFLALGFGLALPYLLLCFVPALTRLLPRPGAWMDTFRQLMAFPMYASAIWLVWVAVRQVGDIGIFYALGGMLGVAFGIWLLRHNHGKGRLHMIVALVAAACILAALAALIWMPKTVPVAASGLPATPTRPAPAETAANTVTDRAVDPAADPAGPAEATPRPNAGTPIGIDPATGMANEDTAPDPAPAGPQPAPVAPPLLAALPLSTPGESRPYTTAALETALTRTTQPILVNMTAAWCITCLVNERTTLATDEVRAWMKTHDVIYFKGDWTNRDPEITEFLGGFGRNGVPLYVFYAGPQYGVRPDPVVLPQILTATMIKNLIP